MSLFILRWFFHSADFQKSHLQQTVWRERKLVQWSSSLIPGQLDRRESIESYWHQQQNDVRVSKMPQASTILFKDLCNTLTWYPQKRQYRCSSLSFIKISSKSWIHHRTILFQFPSKSSFDLKRVRLLCKAGH